MRLAYCSRHEAEGAQEQLSCLMIRDDEGKPMAVQVVWAEIESLVNQRDKLLAAAKNLRDVKGRHHSEQAMARLIEAIKDVEAA